MSIFRKVWVSHLVVLQSLTLHKASATKLYSKTQPAARKTAIFFGCRGDQDRNVAAIFRSANKVPFLLLFHRLCTSVYIFRLDRRRQRCKIASSNFPHL
jgi:hypothetical protein